MAALYVGLAEALEAMNIIADSVIDDRVQLDGGAALRVALAELRQVFIDRHKGIIDSTALPSRAVS